MFEILFSGFDWSTDLFDVKVLHNIEYSDNYRFVIQKVGRTHLQKNQVLKKWPIKTFE